LRQQQADLFQQGEYLPLAVEGAKAKHVVAFARKSGTTRALVVVPRLVAGLLNDIDLPPIGPRIWDDTHVLLPFRSCSEKCRNAFTGEVLDLQKTDEYAKIGVSKALAEFPVALCLLD
jgi:(1->4)-alpha-D-glucan 1-alpha-D-glucosylmutase